MRKEQILIPMVRAIIKRPRLANAFFSRDPWGNPFSDEVVDDPMVQADVMRASGPVHRHRLYQQWFVMGYDEAREVLASPHVGTQNQAEILLDVRPYTQLSPRSRALFANLMVLVDPPSHGRLRGLVNRAFTPRQVARLDERMTKLATSLIAEFGDGEVELMSSFATPFPAQVIADLMGLPPEEWRWLSELSFDLVPLLDAIRGFDPARVDAAVDRATDRLLALAADRRRDPRDDLITGLALAEADDGDRLSEEELVAVSVLILLAGHDTTAGMFANALLALQDHPDQADLLRSPDADWPCAIEEFLRFDTSVRTIPRAALEDFELAGHTIKAGENIAVIPQLANRDLRRFDDADELRLERENTHIVSFGHGIHYCLGANLARAELRTGLPLLLDALGPHSIDRTRIEWRPSITVRVPATVPITRA